MQTRVAAPQWRPPTTGLSFETDEHPWASGACPWEYNLLRPGLSAPCVEQAQGLGLGIRRHRGAGFLGRHGLVGAEEKLWLRSVTRGGVTQPRATPPRVTSSLHYKNAQPELPCGCVGRNGSSREHRCCTPVESLAHYPTLIPKMIHEKHHEIGKLETGLERTSDRFGFLLWMWSGQL